MAEAYLKSEGISSAWAWNAGILWKMGSGFSFGASYRSDFTINGDGNASFTQVPTGYPEFDGLLGTIFPFDGTVPIEATIAFSGFLECRSRVAEREVDHLGPVRGDGVERLRGSSHHLP